MGLCIYSPLQITHDREIFPDSIWFIYLEIEVLRTTVTQPFPFPTLFPYRREIQGGFVPKSWSCDDCKPDLLIHNTPRQDTRRSPSRRRDWRGWSTVIVGD